MKIAGEIKFFLDDERTYAQLKYSEADGRLSLDTLLVPPSHRNNGVGSQLVRHFLDLADTWRRDVHIAARPIGVGSGAADRLDKLFRFYSRLGFEETGRGITVIHMVRRFTT